jgi:AsmA family protein
MGISSQPSIGEIRAAENRESSAKCNLRACTGVRAIMRWVKIAGVGVGVLLLLAVGAGLALYFGGGQAVKWVLEHPGSTLTGRTIKIGGRVQVRWGAPTRIVIEDLHVANASWDSQHEMFTAKRLELQIFARTLIFGPTRIPVLRLDGSKLLLETSRNGEGNWKFDNGAPKKRTEFPHLLHFEVNDSALVYHNGQTKAETDLGVGHLVVDDPDTTGAVKVAADGTFQKLPLKLAGTFGALTELRDATKPYPVKLTGALGHVDLAFDGTIKEPLDFDGLALRLSISGSKLDEVASALGVPMPELPDFRGTSKLVGGEGKWRLDALTLKVGDSDLEGGLDINTNETVPRLTANLTSSDIDLGDFKGFYGGRPDKTSAPPPPPDPSGRVIPDTKIDVHKLPGLNLALNFDGAKIEAAGGLPFERVTLGIKIENGELTIDPLTFHVALGDFTLHAHFNPFTQDSPPKLQGHIDIQHIDLHKLLGGPTMPAIVQETAGNVGGFITIDTSGVSLRQFLANMNGDVGVFVENGQMSSLLEKLAPLDVLEALGVFAMGDHPLPIDCVVSRFDVKAGIATATTFLVRTANTTIVGSGNLNFGSETPFLRLAPYNNSFAPVSLRTPIDVQGTFKNPAFHVETGNLVARLGAAAGLGVLFPPAALLPLIDTGLGDKNACSRAYQAQEPPGDATPKSGSSTPPEPTPKKQ